jgi:hypothetical protein
MAKPPKDGSSLEKSRHQVRFKFIRIWELPKITVVRLQREAAAEDFRTLIPNGLACRQGRMKVFVASETLIAEKGAQRRELEEPS